MSRKPHFNRILKTYKQNPEETLHLLSCVQEEDMLPISDLVIMYQCRKSKPERELITAMAMIWYGTRLSLDECTEKFRLLQYWDASYIMMYVLQYQSTELLLKWRSTLDANHDAKPFFKTTIDVFLVRRRINDLKTEVLIDMAQDDTMAKNIMPYLLQTDKVSMQEELHNILNETCMWNEKILLELLLQKRSEQDPSLNTEVPLSDVIQLSDAGSILEEDLIGWVEDRGIGMEQFEGMPSSYEEFYFAVIVQAQFYSSPKSLREYAANLYRSYKHHQEVSRRSKNTFFNPELSDAKENYEQAKVDVESIEDWSDVDYFVELSVKSEFDLSVEVLDAVAPHCSYESLKLLHESVRHLPEKAGKYRYKMSTLEEERKERSKNAVPPTQAPDEWFWK